MYGKFIKMGICLIVKSGGGIDTSSATATADKILNGYTIYKDDNKITGSMTNVGKQTTTGLNASGSTMITAGWHDGTGSVTTNSLSSQTGGVSITASDVLNSYTYWVSGSKGTGTMTNRGTKAWTMGVNGSAVTIESGWHSGSGTVKQSSTVNTSSEWKLMRPTTSNQTLCNSGWYYSQNRWCEGASTLTKDNIKNGVSIFGVAGTYVETQRYIIKNGASTGIGSLTPVRLATYGKDGTPGNLTYDGSTWVFLTGVRRWTNNRATNLMGWHVSYIPNIASLAKCTWSGTADYDKNGTYSFGFRVRGDLLVWGYHTGASLVFQIKVKPTANDGEWGIGYNTSFSNLGNLPDTKVTKSMPTDIDSSYNGYWQTNYSYDDGYTGKIPKGALVIDGSGNSNILSTSGWGSGDHWCYVYCKNLWLDTTLSASS